MKNNIELKMRFFGEWPLKLLWVFRRWILDFRACVCKRGWNGDGERESGIEKYEYCMQSTHCLLVLWRISIPMEISVKGCFLCTMHQRSLHLVIGSYYFYLFRYTFFFLDRCFNPAAIVDCIKRKVL